MDDPMECGGVQAACPASDHLSDVDNEAVGDGIGGQPGGGGGLNLEGIRDGIGKEESGCQNA